MAIVSRVLPESWAQSDDTAAYARVMPQSWDQIAAASTVTTVAAIVIANGILSYKAAATGSDYKLVLVSGVLNAKLTTAGGDKVVRLVNGVREAS